MINLRKTVNRMSIGIILYNLILFLSVIIDAMVKSGELLFQDHAATESVNQMLDQISIQGTSSIIGVTLGIVFLILFHRKSDLKDQIFKTDHSITKGSFWRLFCILMSAQIIFTIVAAAAESGLNVFGYTIMSDVETATGVSKTISMFLYSGVIGPIAEEIVYRGFVMRSLEKYGKTYAIILSALMFGISHGNFLQGMFAFYVGCVLGYVAMEYSIQYAIAMHVINNMVFGDLWEMAVQRFPEQLQTVLFHGCMFLFFCAGIISVWQKRERIKTYIQTKKIPVKDLVSSLTTPGALILIGIELMAALDGIQKMK